MSDEKKRYQIRVGAYTRWVSAEEYRVWQAKRDLERWTHALLILMGVCSLAALAIVCQYGVAWLGCGDQVYWGPHGFTCPLHVIPR